MAAELYKLGIQAEALGLKLGELGDPGASVVVDMGKNMQAKAGELFSQGAIRPSLDTPLTVEELNRETPSLTRGLPRAEYFAPGIMKTSSALRARIANALAREIVVLDDGTKLPSMDKLGEMYGVSRLTAIAAVKKLESLGMVSIVQGGGTRVKKSPQT